MFRRLLAEWVILLALGLIFVALGTRADLMARFDAGLLDRAAALTRAAPADDIVVVAFDDPSLEAIGPWPWPRARHAALIDALAEVGAGPILLDVLFLEPTSPADDAALAAAMRRHGVLYLPHTFVPRANTQSAIDPALPIPVLAEAAAGVGHVASAPDADGVLRRFDLVRDIDGAAFPHFVLAASGVTPADAPEAAIVSFHGDGAYARHSAAAILSGTVPAEFLRGKTVLVGATAQGMGDRYSVGAGGVAVMPGVETQANLLDALRQGALVRDASALWSALLGALALLIQFLVFWKLSARAGLIATISISAALLAIAVLLVPLTHFWVGPGVALLAVLFAYPLWSWRRLTSVSAYLEEEAAFLRPAGAQKADVEGFDQLARQVARMRRLVNHVSRSFAFLGKVIEAAPDAILVLDREGLVTMANQSAKRLFPGFAEETPAPLADLLADSMATHRPDDGEISFPDGTAFLVARAGFELEGDAQSGEIMALRDVTEIRQREQERREMLEFLSHDMRTPQVAIIGLSRKVGTNGSDHDIGPRIRNQAERTLKLADDFVQIARLAETKPQFEEADLVALVEEAADRAYAAARAKAITVLPDLPEDLLFAEVDASLIARLLDNLVGNAIKFSPESSTVKVILREVSESVMQLSVCDEGPGLPPERLTNPFARFGAHETKAGPSVGLGLTFVKRVVDLHHGTITVDSAPGAGTCFRIDVPEFQPFERMT